MYTCIWKAEEILPVEGFEAASSGPPKRGDLAYYGGQQRLCIARSARHELFQEKEIKLELHFFPFDFFPRKMET